MQNTEEVRSALSDRILALSESQTIAMAKKARELAAQGHDVINLSFGEPDFQTPQYIKDAAKQAKDTVSGQSGGTNGSPNGGPGSTYTTS